MNFTVHHIRVLMKFTLASATISTAAVGCLVALRGQDVWWLILIPFSFAFFVPAWWTIRTVVLLRRTRLFAVVRGLGGLFFGAFNCFLWGFTFQLVFNLMANQSLPAEWQWAAPAFMSGAVLGLIAGAAEAAARGIRRPDPEMPRISK